MILLIHKYANNNSHQIVFQNIDGVNDYINGLKNDDLFFEYKYKDDKLVKIKIKKNNLSKTIIQKIYVVYLENHIINNLKKSFENKSSYNKLSNDEIMYITKYVNYC
jgi:hypothetical protein